MSESLRDRVARVLGEAHTSDGRRAVPAGDTTARADALIAAGLVAVQYELDDSEGSAFCTCGAGPFPNFAVSPLPYFQEHLRRVAS